MVGAIPLNRPYIKSIGMIEGLKDQVVIVTGGAHGIGKAYCNGFAGAGARVVIADIDMPGAEAAAKEIGAQALPIQVDVSNEEATKKMAAQALDRFGRIDVLINNAAVFSVVPMNRGRIETIDPAEWDKLMAVNLRGLFFCCRAVLPAMRAQKAGKIINIASGTVFAGSPGRIHYVTSKTATIGFTRTLGARSRRRQYQRQLPGPRQHVVGRKSQRRKPFACASPPPACAPSNVSKSRKTSSVPCCSSPRH